MQKIIRRTAIADLAVRKKRARRCGGHGRLGAPEDFSFIQMRDVKHATLTSTTCNRKTEEWHTLTSLGRHGLSTHVGTKHFGREWRHKMRTPKAGFFL